MLSKISVKKPYTVLVGVVLVLVLGYVSFTKMKTDLLPDMNLPYAIVYTTYIGASPEQVEASVTRPIEQSMATISNVESISSTSSENVSMVIMEFAQSADMDSITVDMREKLDQLESVWDDAVGNPVIMKLNPNMLPIMVAGLEAGEMTQAELSDLVNDEILQELESIEGVASVSEVGTIEEKVQVVIREDKIKDVNKKVYDALDQKFADARAELEENKEKLEEGEEQLDDGKEALKSATGSAQEKLEEGRTQMVGGQIGLSQKMDEVTKALAELDQSEKELLEKELQMLQGEAALEALPAQLESLQAQKRTTEQALSVLSYVNAASVEALNTSIRELEKQITELGGTTPSDTDGTDEAAMLQSEKREDTYSADMEAGGSEIELFSDTEEDIDTDVSIGNDAGGEEQEINLDSGVSDIQIPSTDDILKGIEDLTNQASTLATLQTLYQQLVEQRGQLNALGIDTTLTGKDLEDNIASVKKTVSDADKKLGDGIDQIQEQVDNTEQQKATISEGKQAIEEGKKQIAEGREQLLAAQEQLLAAQDQLTKGSTGLGTAQAQLDGAKIDAIIEMASGKAQLTSGKTQIEAALDQIEEQKEAAYDQADVREIVTTSLVKGILAGQNFMMPAGYVTEGVDDILVRVGDKLKDTEDLENLMILDLHMDGLDPIYLSDVADVITTDDSDEVYASVNGKPGVVFSMQKQSGYSTGEVSDNIAEKFRQIENTREGIHFISMMDQGIYIDLVVNSVMQNMLSGAALAILILLLFLRSVRPTFVIACSIPISLVAAVVLMYFSNISLNIISLSGLALGVGMLVDNSIVVIENIYRLRGEGYPVRKAAVEGANQVAGAILASTLTTVCVFAPIVFTEGITKQLFVDMGLTIGYSLTASLVVALTVVPAMASGVLKKPLKGETKVFAAIQNVYAKILRGTLKVKVLVILAAIGMLAFSAKLSLSKGTEFMGEMESTQISVTLTPEKGSSLKEIKEMSDEAIERILTIQDVEDVGAMTGGSALMSLMGGGSDGGSVSMYVLMSEDKTIKNQEVAAAILEQTQDLNCEVEVQTSNMDMSALGGSGISVQIKGRDLDTLKEISTDMAQLLESVEGTKNVSDGIDEKQVEFRLVVDKNKAMEYQLTTAQVFQMLSEKLADATSATILSTDTKDLDVYVISDSDETLTRDKIENLTIEGTNADNEKEDIPLKDLVEFKDTEGFTSISREAQSRYVTASAELEDGYNIGLVAEEVQKKLDAYQAPEGYKISLTGENETINDAMQQVMLMMVLAIIFMYLIMVAQFQSLLSPFIILFTIPLAFTGGFLGLYLTDNPVSVIGLIGFVMLAGIIVNNGIVLVDYINQLRREGMMKKEAIVEAGRTRLRPVIMTALTTILGLCTMALGNGMGADMVQPMAIVTIGGLIYGTLMTLFVIPCVYDIFNRNKDLTEKDDF